MSQFQNQPGEHMPPGGTHNQPGNNGMAIAALVVGIVALVGAFLFPFIVDIIVAVVGIVLAVVARNQGHKGGMVVAGLVCSIIALVLSVLFLACIGCVACAFLPYL